MNGDIPSVIFFAERDYVFIKSALISGQVLLVDKPSELLELIKGDQVSIVIFDMAHSQFAESLVRRIYRRAPLSEYWLVGDVETVDLPDYVIDMVIPPTIRKADFEGRLQSCRRVKSLVAEFGMVGKSVNLKHAVEMVTQVAPTDIATLIIGPSGAGKELVARAVHKKSARSKGTFVAVNCGALTESLLESELFGHEKGSFTGAVGRREGIFKRADGGTVFLDEVGDMSPALQVKLLRVLEEGTFYRVGGNEPVHADIRVVAATNRDLGEAIADGNFREDLYFRLGAVRIKLAGLAERKADIIPLINHFFIQETGACRGMSEKAMQILIDYGWPGNVREVKNFVSRIIVAPESGEISERLVTQFIEEQGYVHRTLPVVTGKAPQEAEFQLIYHALLSLGQEVRMLRDIILNNLPDRHDAYETEEAYARQTAMTMDEMEQDMIRKTLASVNGNRREAARKLGVGERTLYRKLKKYGLT